MRLRLILSFTLIVLVTLAGVIFFARQATEQAVGEFMVRGGMVDSADLANQLEAYYANAGSWAGVQRLIGGAGMGGMMGGGQGMRSQRLRVADAAGVVVADTVQSGMGQSLDTEERSQAVRLSGPDGGTAGFLVGESGFGSEQPLLGRINAAALQAGLLAGLIALALALGLAYTIVRPIQTLSQAAVRMASGDLSQRVPLHGRDEISRLGETLNALAASLQQAQESRQAMTADIAHELRTPLAVQRAQLEALQDDIYPLTLENLRPLAEQNVILNRLVEDLGTLALADAGELPLELVETDLRLLCEQALERFRPQAGQRQVRIECEAVLGEQNCPQVVVDPLRAGQVLGNLISNALRYTPQGGQIVLRIDCQPGQAALEVQDSGPGIPVEALPHIFERFYRAERARSRSAGGSGLGLAIARQLTRAMGGELTADNVPGSGALFRWTFSDTKSSRGGTHAK